MALTHRIKSLERQLGQDTLVIISYADGQPVRCVHGRPRTQEIPPNFKGRIIRVIYPTDWKGLAEALDHRNPRPCSCETNNVG